jgi:hypothetical protein
MSNQTFKSTAIPEEVFQAGAVYVLIREGDGEWFERSLEELYVITDHEDFLSALIIELDKFGYKLPRIGSFTFEKTGNFVYKIDVEYDNGIITFSLVHIKNAKEFPHQFPDSW